MNDELIEEFKQAELFSKKELYDAEIRRYADSIPTDPPNYRSTMARFIENSMYEDECIFFVVYGPLRYGKTAYAVKTLAWLYKTYNPEVLKNFIIFHPLEFTEALKKPISTGIKYPALLWDDAGVWLNAMKWNEPLLKRIQEYFNVVGVNYASIIFTTPLPTYILKKIRGLPLCFNVRIVKVYPKSTKKIRRAIGYRQWLHPDMKKSGVKMLFVDEFSAIMPTNFFNWYINHRKQYSTMAYKALETELYKSAAKVLAEEKAPDVKGAVEEVDEIW